MSRFVFSLLLMALLGLVSGGVAAQDAEPDEATGESLSAPEVETLFTGNTETAVAMKKGVETGRRYKAFYLNDGTYVIEEKNGFRYGGAWFVDPLGRHCFRPGNKDKTKCDVIVREGDHYIRLRDGGRRGRFSIEKGNTID
jgi:hypothetical protein